MGQLRALEKWLSKTEISMWEQIITIREEADGSWHRKKYSYSMKHEVGYLKREAKLASLNQTNQNKQRIPKLVRSEVIKETLRQRLTKPRILLDTP